MSLREALNTDPHLMDQTRGLKPDAETISASMESKSRPRFFTYVGFHKGRLYEVYSSVSNLRQESAGEFTRNVFRQLGKPDGTLLLKNDYRRKCWVWIDGDVRISYEERRFLCSPSDEFEVVMQLVMYPVYINQIAQPLVPYAEADWGARPYPTFHTAYPLDHSLAGITLGMTSDEVATVLASSSVRYSPPASNYGLATAFFDNGNEVRIRLSKGRVIEIHEDRFDISSAQLKRELEDKYGPDNAKSSDGTVWIDGDIALGIESRNEANEAGSPSSRPFVTLHLTDGNQEHQSSEFLPAAKYEDAPSEKSFFLPADLSAVRITTN
jgi:hypothetical protein